MSGADTYTLTEIARRLGEPQHRLIHLCEKGVIRPDHRDAEGRGSSRVFSARNLLEFAIALQLRAMSQPLAGARAVVHVLRGLEKEICGQIAGFELPGGLRGRSAPDLRVIVSDGSTLFFSLGRRGQKPKLFGGVPLDGSKPAGRSRESRKRPSRADGSFGTPEGSRYARLELSITRVAQDLPLD